VNKFLRRLKLTNTSVEAARNYLPIIHDIFRRKQDVKLSSGTAILASAARNDLPIIHDIFRRKQDVKLSSGTAILASAS